MNVKCTKMMVIVDTQITELWFKMCQSLLDGGDVALSSKDEASGTILSFKNSEVRHQESGRGWAWGT